MHGSRYPYQSRFFLCYTTELSIWFGKTSRHRTDNCQSGVWRSRALERTTWFAVAPDDKNGGKDYGDICHAQLDSSGMLADGWVATGSDACSEDVEYCTVDGVRCFAIRLH